jgi:hypothetical protein
LGWQSTEIDDESRERLNPGKLPVNGASILVVRIVVWTLLGNGPADGGVARNRRKLDLEPDLSVWAQPPGDSEFSDGCLILAFRVKGNDLRIKGNRVWMLRIAVETPDHFPPDEEDAR